MSESNDKNRVEVVREHMRDWLWRDLTGCSFASHLAATSDRIGYAVVPSLITTKAAIDALEDAIDGYAGTQLVAIVIFPTIETPTELARLLAALRDRERWSLTRITDDDGLLHRTATALSLRWTTKTGIPSSVMGLAPFGVMPVMRRAPYAAFVAWGGGPRRTPADSVGLIDIPVDMDAKKRATMMKATAKRVAALAGRGEEPPTVLREVAFVLPRTVVRSQLRSLPEFKP